MFKHDFVANFLPGQLVKKIENRLIFDEVMGKSFMSVFFWLKVYMYALYTDMKNSQYRKFKKLLSFDIIIQSK